MSAAPRRTGASIPGRRARTRTIMLTSAAVAPVTADGETREALAAAKRMPVDGDLIRRRWRSLIGRHPPKALSYALMDRILAWREQVAAGGGINSRSRAILAAALAGKAVDVEKNSRDQVNVDGSGSGVHRSRPRAPVRVGTALIREHAGVLHRVTVVPGGFEWDGEVYASLSAVARAITGVRWNGHRFFALDRDAKRACEPRTKGRTAGARSASSWPTDASTLEV